MKTVIYIRHAKSSWADAQLRDKERPLNERGKRDAPYMAEQLRRLSLAAQIKPQAILSSTAQRTRETLVPFQKVFELENHTYYEDKLYHGSSDDLMEGLFAMKEEYESILVFAHNPGITDLYFELGGFIQNIPTCGMFQVEFDVEKWFQVDNKSAHLGFYTYPKLYNEK